MLHSSCRAHFDISLFPCNVMFSSNSNETNRSINMIDDVEKEVTKLSILFNSLMLDINAGKQSPDTMDIFYEQDLPKAPAKAQKAFLQAGQKSTINSCSEMAKASDAVLKEFAKFLTPAMARASGKAAQHACRLLGDEASAQLRYISNEFSKANDNLYADPEAVIGIYKKSNSFKP